MTDKFTKGPWTLKQSAKWPFSLWTEAADGTVIACDDLASYSTGDTVETANAREGNAERIANARLRAAAPSLLEALEKCAAGYAALTALLTGGPIYENGKRVGMDALAVHSRAGEECARAAISSARGEG